MNRKREKKGSSECGLRRTRVGSDPDRTPSSRPLRSKAPDPRMCPQGSLRIRSRHRPSTFRSDRENTPCLWSKCMPWSGRILRRRRGRPHTPSPRCGLAGTAPPGTRHTGGPLLRCSSRQRTVQPRTRSTCCTRGWWSPCKVRSRTPILCGIRRTPGKAGRTRDGRTERPRRCRRRRLSRRSIVCRQWRLSNRRATRQERVSRLNRGGTGLVLTARAKFVLLRTASRARTALPVLEGVLRGCTRRDLERGGAAHRAREATPVLRCRAIAVGVGNARRTWWKNAGSERSTLRRQRKRRLGSLTLCAVATLCILSRGAWLPLVLCVATTGTRRAC